jgi:hypothetical protein
MKLGTKISVFFCLVAAYAALYNGEEFEFSQPDWSRRASYSENSIPAAQNYDNTATSHRGPSKGVYTKVVVK